MKVRQVFFSDEFALEMVRIVIFNICECEFQCQYFILIFANANVNTNITL